MAKEKKVKEEVEVKKDEASIEGKLFFRKTTNTEAVFDMEDGKGILSNHKLVIDIASLPEDFDFDKRDVEAVFRIDIKLKDK